jgi:hypothetical protein
MGKKNKNTTKEACKIIRQLLDLTDQVAQSKTVNKLQAYRNAEKFLARKVTG